MDGATLEGGRRASHHQRFWLDDQWNNTVRLKASIDKKREEMAKRPKAHWLELADRVVFDNICF